MSSYYTRLEASNINRLASGLFFRVEQNEQLVQPSLLRSREVAPQEMKYDEFVVPEYHLTKEANDLYLPLLEVSVEVEVTGTIAWTKLTQTFTNRATFPLKETTYCFPLYDKSTVTSFTCSIGTDQVLNGVIKPKSEAKAEFTAAVARQRVAALLEEHTPEVFETSVGNIPAQSTVKIEICYITELKGHLSGDGILVTIPTSVAPRYGTPPSSFLSSTASKSLAVPAENGLQIQIQVSSPVAINSIESRTHPVSIEMGSHGHTATKDIRNLAKTRNSSDYDPTRARATLCDRSACLGKDFVLLIQCRGGTLLASRAIQETHPKLAKHSALMVSINLRDMFTPNVIAPKAQSEIIFLADRSGSMKDKIEALKTAMGFFLKSLPTNCSFNICSFGSKHILMWPESRPYTQENLDEAMSYVVTNFCANMGGTEILSGLKNVVHKRNPAFKTQVIVLTDGEVWDSANIFEFIRATRSARVKGETRFFALGIGDAVSHHLIEGIGRHGGGLAEVVSVDSTGAWKGRVIRMLEAALTPSTWKVEISMDDIPITTKGDERLCIQAPYRIPDFHAFTRSSVYFLFQQEFKGKAIIVKATATSGEAVTAELPIQSVESKRTCVHLLAAKAVLNDLESGQSWLHTFNQSGNGKSKTGIEDLARAEGEKIGTEWSISSKWTSFVVVDNSNSIEKPSRWYQAERTDLSELTRTRFGVTKRSFPPYSLPGAPGSFHVQGPGRRPPGAMPSATESDDEIPPCSPPGAPGSFHTQGPGRRPPGAMPSATESDDRMSFGLARTLNTYSTFSSCAGSSSIRDQVWQAEGRLVAGEGNGAVATLGLPAAFDPTLMSPQMLRQNSAYGDEWGSPSLPNSMSRSSKSFVGTVLGVETTTDEKQKRSTVESEPLLFSLSDLQCSFREGLGAGDESDEASLRESLELRGDSEADEEKPSVAKAMPRKMLSMEEMREVVAEQSMSTRSPGLEEVVQYFSVPMGRTDSVMSADENQYAPKRKKSEKNKGRRQSPVGYEGSSPPASDINTGSGPTRLNTSKQSVTELERQRIAREITLEELMAAQTAEGSFKLDDDVLKHRFTYWRFDLLADELGEDILHTNLERVLDTARAIVFIYVMYPDSDELWRLVVQKADGFVETVISDKEWRRLFRVLRSQLRDGREKTIQAFRDSRWFQGRHRFLAGGFDLILRSHILDDPHELRRLLRSCIRDRTYSQKGLIQNLGRKIQDTKADGQLYEAKIKDFDEWTDGWDDVLKLSLGIRSVMREMGYLEP